MSTRNDAAGKKPTARDLRRTHNNRRDHRFSKQRDEPSPASDRLFKSRFRPQRIYEYVCRVPQESIYVVTDEDGLMTTASAPCVRFAGLIGHSLDSLRMHLIISGKASSERDIHIELIQR